MYPIISFFIFQVVNIRQIQGVFEAFREIVGYVVLQTSISHTLCCLFYNSLCLCVRGKCVQQLFFENIETIYSYKTYCSKKILLVHLPLPIAQVKLKREGCSIIIAFLKIFFSWEVGVIKNKAYCIWQGIVCTCVQYKIQ